MTKKSKATALDLERAKHLYRGIHESHLFGEFSRLVSIGAYQRISDFREVKCVLTTQQRTSLENALQRELPDSAVDSIQGIIPRVIEHELIMVRAPSISEIIKVIEELEQRATECLSIFRNLQITFNSEDQQIALPTIAIGSDTGSFAGPPDAYTAAVNVIRRNMTEPIPAYLNLGPLIVVCRQLKENYQTKRGPKPNSFLSLFLFTLGMSAGAAGVKLALPSKNSFVRAATDRPTVFLNFARAALVILRDVGTSSLVNIAITPSERKEVHDRLQAFHNLSDEALSEHLGSAIRLKRSGLAEFLEAATQGVNTGSTP